MDGNGGWEEGRMEGGGMDGCRMQARGWDLGREMQLRWRWRWRGCVACCESLECRATMEYVLILEVEEERRGEEKRG